MRRSRSFVVSLFMRCSCLVCLKIQEACRVISFCCIFKTWFSWPWGRLCGWKEWVVSDRACTREILSYVTIVWSILKISYFHLLSWLPLSRYFGWDYGYECLVFCGHEAKGKKINPRILLLWFCITWLSYLIFLRVKFNSCAFLARSWHYFYLSTQHLSLNFMGVAACYLLLWFLVVVVFRFFQNPLLNQRD